MPSVATIESVLRLSAPVQLRVSVPVQLRVSAPVQFRLGPASQRAECREVSVPDWLPRAQSGAEQRMSVPDWLVDWLPPSAEWSRAEWIGCLSPFSPSRIGLLAPESVCPRSASFPGLAGRLAAADRRVESVCPRSALVQPFPNRPPRARECLSPFSPPPNRPPREVSVPDWLVDWLPPSAEWSRECLSLFDLPRSTSRARPPVRPPLPNQPREVSVPDWLVDWLPPNSE